MKNTINSALACIAILLTAGCATQKSADSKAPTGPPDATIAFNMSQGGYHVSAGSGKGTVNYQGSSRNFKISAVGAGGTGVQKIDAVGEVYNLNSLSDFSGSYTGARSGLTLFKGKMHEKLKNGRGVVIYVTGTTSGLASSLGADELTITLE